MKGKPVLKVRLPPLQLLRPIQQVIIQGDGTDTESPPKLVCRDDSRCAQLQFFPAARRQQLVSVKGRSEFRARLDCAQEPEHLWNSLSVAIGSGRWKWKMQKSTEMEKAVSIASIVYARALALAISLALAYR